MNSKKKKREKQWVIFSYDIKEQKSIVFPFFFIFHPKLLNQWKSERCKAISDNENNAFIGYQSNVSYNVVCIRKIIFLRLSFFLFFPFILTGKRRFDLRVSSLISSIDRNLLPFFFLSLYKDATGLSRT